MQKEIPYASTPVFFSRKDKVLVKKLLRSGNIQQVIDHYEGQLKELAESKNLKKTTRAHKKEGIWVYYPWSFSLVHILSQQDFRRVRTSRNQNLITSAEQQKIEKATIGIAGLNVGNPGSLCMALEGFEKMKLADNDFLSLANLNRFRAGVHQIGINKTHLTARQIYETNPFAKLKLFPKGITQKNIETFLLKPKVDVLIEEMDNLELKISIREKARAYRIPVVMVTGNGENVILDIERYDKNPKLPLLNGHLKPAIMKRIKQVNLRDATIQKKVLLARDFMGEKYLTKRLRQSFLQVGSELGGIPQIAEASFMRGAVLCYAVRQIVLGSRAPSGRFLVNLIDIF